jgi:glutamate/tyrosine decarboxylase-like PLP-dependent enzyme
MSKIWKKRSQEEIKSVVFKALEENVNFSEQNILGIPASYLDDKVFNQDASFVKDAPFISTLIQNPNHIGCHTLGSSESFFRGTQQIEKDLIDICGTDILKGETGKYDGYVASGGTEANIQAMWIYRNFFMQERGASREEIAIIASADTHYSVDKAGNLLALTVKKTPVNENRQIEHNSLRKTLKEAQNEGFKHFIVISNMMTTMFGSVDDINVYTDVLTELNCDFKLHVDGAYGGFYYPFTNKNEDLTFQNEHISSFTLDAHKMAQAPYGTGIFIIRKGLIHFANTREASYVEGEDYTLIGSRSGANAVAVWMILTKNGPYGWHEKVFILQKRTGWMCDKLTELGIEFYRHEHSNIVTIKNEFINKETALKFGLVPDNHANPNWYKIVVMEHVTIEKLSLLVEDIKSHMS